MKKRGPAFESVLLRSRLVAAAQEQSGVVTVEAPVGFGKSVYLRQLVEVTGGFYVGSREDVASTIALLDCEPSESVLVAVDDASSYADEIMELAEHDALNTLVIADRYLTPELIHLAEQYEHRRLTAHDLRFTESEMQELAEKLAPVSGTHPPTDGPPDLAERVAYVVGPASEGWPEAAVWMLHRSFTSGDPLTIATELSYPGPDADAFLELHLAALAEHLKEAVQSLAHFDAFTGSCVDALIGQDLSLIHI